MRGNKVTTAAPAPQTTASTSHELRGTPIETGPNPKKRLLVRSALSAASGSGQQHVKKSATDAEPEAPIEVPVEMGTDKRVAWPNDLAANTRRRIAEKSFPTEIHPIRSTIAITTQERADGRLEKKTMRIANVEKVEMDNILELSVTFNVLKWARQPNLTRGASLSNADG